MKQHVGFGRSRVPDIHEKRFSTGQGSSDHMNLHFRQSVSEFENSVRSLYGLDIADPQYVDIACGYWQRLLYQHSRHSTRQPVAARQCLCLRSALYKDGIGALQAVRIQPTIARKSYEHADAGPVTVRITR